MLRAVIPLRAASCSIVRSSSPIEGHNIAESCASKQRDIKWCNVVAVPIVDEHAAPRPDRAFPRHGQGTLPTGRGACPAGRAPVSTGRALFTPSRSTLPPAPRGQPPPHPHPEPAPPRPAHADAAAERADLEPHDRLLHR